MSNYVSAEQVDEAALRVQSLELTAKQCGYDVHVASLALNYLNKPHSAYTEAETAPLVAAYAALNIARKQLTEAREVLSKLLDIYGIQLARGIVG